MTKKYNYIVGLITVLLFSTQLSAQKALSKEFFNDANSFFQKYVVGNNINYTEVKNAEELNSIIKQVETMDLTSASALEKKAFYINAYNLLVINQVAVSYPIASVQEINGFFDTKRVKVAGETMTLNQLEKKKLLEETKDARLHFVLVCGALSCPPIINQAYYPETLESQMDEQARKAMDNSSFIKVNGDKTELSQIFKWYASDFGKSKSNILAFINKYRTEKISSGSKISYYTYDWTLNDISLTGEGTDLGNNAIRYVVSSTIPKGSSELKIFNNLYSQNNFDRNNRNTFFTTSFSYLYGVNNRVNLGVSVRYRRVRNSVGNSSPFNISNNNLEENESFRQGLTYIGPQIRWAPVEKWTNFSIQSAFLIPGGREQEGTATSPFIDFNNPTWWTQFFNDFPIGSSFSLFTEIDLLYEDIGRQSEGAFNRVSTPATVIFSYFPHPKVTFYGLSSFSPFFVQPFDYFYQLGTGFKYQFNRKFELELLYNSFRNRNQVETGGVANTYNMGLRFSF